MIPDYIMLTFGQIFMIVLGAASLVALLAALWVIVRGPE